MWFFFGYVPNIFGAIGTNKNNNIYNNYNNNIKNNNNYSHWPKSN